MCSRSSARAAPSSCTAPAESTSFHPPARTSSARSWTVMSAGDLRPDGDVEQVARAYEAAGARAMSVLVDERFGGSWDDLRAARAVTRLPLLAKGFFSSPADFEQARDAGADAVLILLRDLA